MPERAWHLQANDNLLPGSVRASASDAVVSDLIEHRLEVMARALVPDSERGLAQSAFQPTRLASRLANQSDRQQLRSGGPGWARLGQAGLLNRIRISPLKGAW